jgi:hypothetical protein
LHQLLPEHFELTWTDGEKVERGPAFKLTIPGPAAAWTDPDTRQRREVPEAALRSIQWNSHTLGAGRGFLIGGLALGLPLALLGALSGSDRPCPPRGTPEVFYCFSASAGEKAAIGGALGFLAGSVVGVVIGAIAGSRMTVDFEPRPVAALGNRSTAP